MANTWQGEFPVENLELDGYAGTAPVGRYPANGYGLLDMVGNVWEWTSDWYQAHGELAHACCTATNPRGGDREHSRDPNDVAAIPRRVIKGGSHLCAPNYCRRYRPAARMAQAVDTQPPTSGSVASFGAMPSAEDCRACRQCARSDVLDRSFGAEGFGIGLLVLGQAPPSRSAGRR